MRSVTLIHDKDGMSVNPRVKFTATLSKGVLCLIWSNTKYSDNHIPGIRILLWQFFIEIVKSSGRNLWQLCVNLRLCSENIQLV